MAVTGTRRECSRMEGPTREYRIVVEGKERTFPKITREALDWISGRVAHVTSREVWPDGYTVERSEVL